MRRRNADTVSGLEVLTVLTGKDPSLRAVYQSALVKLGGSCRRLRLKCVLARQGQDPVVGDAEEAEASA